MNSNKLPFGIQPEWSWLEDVIGMMTYSAAANSSIGYMRDCLYNRYKAVQESRCGAIDIFKDEYEDEQHVQHGLAGGKIEFRSVDTSQMKGERIKYSVIDDIDTGDFGMAIDMWLSGMIDNLPGCRNAEESEKAMIAYRIKNKDREDMAEFYKNLSRSSDTTLSAFLSSQKITYDKIMEVAKKFKNLNSDTMQTTTQKTPTDGIDITKKEKRELIAQKERTLDSLKKHKAIIDSRLKYNGGKNTILSVESGGYNERLQSPDFMPTATYMKLYMAELDETIDRIESEIDSLLK